MKVEVIIGSETALVAHLTHLGDGDLPPLGPYIEWYERSLSPGYRMATAYKPTVRLKRARVGNSRDLVSVDSYVDLQWPNADLLKAQ